MESLWLEFSLGEGDPVTASHADRQIETPPVVRTTAATTKGRQQWSDGSQSGVSIALLGRYVVWTGMMRRCIVEGVLSLQEVEMPYCMSECDWKAAAMWSH